MSTGVGPKRDVSLPELLQGPVGVGSHAVQFVDEGEEGDVVALHLPVDRHALALHPSHCTQNQHRPVQNTEGALHLDGKVNVTYSYEGRRSINSAPFQ